MKLITKILAFIGALAFTAILYASWFVGDYFVDFAFKPVENGMPAASEIIIDKKEKARIKPDYPNENWTITMENGERRNATAFFSWKENADWVIMVHGYCRNQQFVWDYAGDYLKAGYNVLTPDLNASGTSDGEYLTMGVVESDDILGWTDEIIKRNKNSRIILHGISMGAATIMLATAKELPTNVIAAVEDCGYTSAYDMFCVQLEKNYDLPSFPVMNIINAVSRIKTGHYITEASPIEAVKETKIPMLFIHGSDDKLAPTEMATELFEASAAPVKEKVIISGAGHANSMYVNSDEYYGSIFSFLNKL